MFFECLICAMMGSFFSMHILLYYIYLLFVYLCILKEKSMNVPHIEFLSVSNLLQYYFLEFGIRSRGTLLNHLFPSIVSSLRYISHFLFFSFRRKIATRIRLKLREKSRAGLQTVFLAFYRWPLALHAFTILNGASFLSRGRSFSTQGTMPALGCHSNVPSLGCLNLLEQRPCKRPPWWF